MASCAEGQELHQLLGEELFEDYFNETLNLSSSASASNVTEFKTASNEDLERLISNTGNKNTKKTTRTWVNRFNSWRESRELAQELPEIPPEELDKFLR